LLPGVRRALRVAAFVLGVFAVSATAQVEPANGLLLIAKPGLPDPRFRDTVILVTQTKDFQTVGVILNRPTQVRVQQLREDLPRDGYAGPVFFGGPVLERVLVALFKRDQPPTEPAFHVLKGVYLSMHPALVEPLLARRDAEVRVFAGFSGWAPRQLESELARDSWYVLPATEELLFRKDTSGMWQELLHKATSKRAALYWLS
jgi:putative transcriptional regulator